jgi:hypothetical protein
MMNKDHPAYPLHTLTGQAKLGLTKRELFAAMALQGMLAEPKEDGPNPVSLDVACAIEYADELIRQLSTEVQGE